MKILLVLAAFCFAVHGQEHPELVTDRPDQTESALVVPLNSLQLETGFSYGEEKLTGLGYKRSHDLNNTLLRYGLFEMAELRAGLNMPYFESRGLEYIYNLGSKISLTSEARGIFPQSAIIIDGTIYKRNSNIQVDPGFILAMAYDVTDRLSLGINLGADNLSNDLRFKYATALGFAITQTLAAYTEFYGSDNGNALTVLFDAGITVLINNYNQFDLSAGYSGSKPASWYTALGYSKRFNF